MMVRLAGIKRHSLVNGPGVRYVVFFQGCPHACPGCQNPETWDPSKGNPVDVNALTKDILSDHYKDGVTLSGGDPLLQGEGLLELVKNLKAAGTNIWCYTGWTYEEVVNGKAGPYSKEALSYLDVLVDGPFVLKLLSRDCLFRGSTNQRLIDVPKSLALGRAVEVDSSSFDFGL